MQVGGERTLTVPPAMAYGKLEQKGIPRNSTLIFGLFLFFFSSDGNSMVAIEVKLLGIKS